jgi:hypothetical protein
MAKAEHLDKIFGIHNMIDMDSFMINYKNNPTYQLTESESNDVLETYLQIGYKQLGYKLSHYLKDKCRKQVNDKFNFDLQIEDTVMPLLTSDHSARSYFERQINSWKIVSDITNIKKLIIITSDQVYKHHNKYIKLNANEIKIVANTILKDNQYERAIESFNKHIYSLPEKISHEMITK